MKTLVIAEKFNTALRIGIVLSDGRMKRGKAGSVPVFRFDRPEGEFAVLGLRGHIIELDYPEELSQWSLANLGQLLETTPLKKVSEPRIVEAIRSIVREFDRVIIATDFDREGELIGWETLEIIRKVHPTILVERARYSALTRDEIERAFSDLHEVDKALAEAAESRQEIDLVWGALLNRYLSLTAGQRGSGFLSAGRVQTPTLALLVTRDQEIKEFVPEPFWTLEATGVAEGEEFRLLHEHGIFTDAAEARKVLAALDGATEGKVAEFKEEEVRRRPPVPFSTTLFVSEATRLGLSASGAMRVAEDLYTQGLISYPRTDNTVYPRGLGLRSMVEKFLESPFREEATYILAQPTFRATRGRTETTDHPPIYPTGVVDPKKLKPDHAKVYELVVRRFLATVSPDCVGRSRTTKVRVRDQGFDGKGYKVLDPGWYRVYPYQHPEESALPALHIDQVVPVKDLRLTEDKTQPPRRFSQGSLIQEMERLGLGTKSTRHDILQKLLDRHYVQARYLEPTSTGVAVTEALRAHAPFVTLPDMTHRLEADMELVAESKKAKAEVLEESREMLREIHEALTVNAAAVKKTLTTAMDRQHFVGPCPKCGGALRMQRSPRGSRWVQCVNNPATCTVSYSLPAAGFIEPAPEFLCPTCQTPRVKIVFRGQRPALYCINTECAEHHKAFRIGTCPSCGSPLAIRYSRFGKRFVGCTGYPKCTVTYPLPQRGRLDTEEAPCPACRAPIVTAIEAGRRPWRLCINPECPTRKSAASAAKAEGKSAPKSPVKRTRERKPAPASNAPPGTEPAPTKSAPRKRRSPRRRTAEPDSPGPVAESPAPP
ncbi:MAG TPA: DNA topoisomerase I [Thermoplasmata archaeon]|nr:DNA topoisomerase I [Thermoplasmata archaeon]